MPCAQYNLCHVCYVMRTSMHHSFLFPFSRISSFLELKVSNGLLKKASHCAARSCTLYARSRWQLQLHAALYSLTFILKDSKYFWTFPKSLLDAPVCSKTLLNALLTVKNAPECSWVQGSSMLLAWVALCCSFICITVWLLRGIDTLSHHIMLKTGFLEEAAVRRQASFPGHVAKIPGLPANLN